MTWHRIDDPENPAPKDGTEILLGYFDLPGQRGYEIAWWNSWKKLWHSGRGLLLAAGPFSPTHWMSLPPPPARNDGEEFGLKPLPNPPEKERT